MLKRLLNLPGKLIASIIANLQPDTRKDTKHLSFPKYMDKDDINTVKSAFNDAYTRLKEKGHVKDSRHKIREIVLVKGSKFTPNQEWGFYDPAGKYFVAARCSGRKIEFSVNPDTLRLNPKRGYRDARHEWGHAFLAISRPGTTTDQQHALMGF